MRDDSPTLWNLRMAVRNGQDAGDLPCESVPGRQFQVMANEIAAPVLSSMVNALCIEGLSAYVILALDAATPYVGLEIAEPVTTLWIYPSATAQGITTSVHGGRYLDYNCDRQVPYRLVSVTRLDAVLTEQLCLVLSPSFPLI